jgi:hypothetical protein
MASPDPEGPRSNAGGSYFEVYDVRNLSSVHFRGLTAAAAAIVLERSPHVGMPRACKGYEAHDNPLLSSPDCGRDENGRPAGRSTRELATGSGTPVE